MKDDQTKPLSRQAQKNQTHKLILDAAASLFRQNGYQKTTMRQIAQKANVAIGTTCAHFKDKASLLAATYYHEVERIVRDATSTIPLESGINEKVVHVVGALFTHFATSPQLTETWIKETLFMKGAWGDKFNELYERCRMVIKYQLLEAKDQGLINEACNCELVSIGIMSHYYFVSVNGQRWNLSVTEQIELFSELMKSQLHGYMKA